MSSLNFTDVVKKHRQLFSPTVTVILNTIYSVICTAGFTNNLLVILVYYKNRSIRRPFNIMLLNLFLADMMTTIAIQPYVWIDFTEITQEGILARVLCASSVGLVLPTICMTPNAISLFVITVLRYCSIVRGYRGFFTSSKNAMKVLCVFTWIPGCILAVPGALSLRYNHQESICYRKWSFGINGKLFSAITTSFLLVGVLLCLVICYIALAIHVCRQSRSPELDESAAGRAKNSITLLLGLLIFAFIICWFPFYMVWFLGRTFDGFSNDADGEFERQRWIRVACIFTVLNTVFDPFIYAYSSAEYRAAFKRCFGQVNSQSVDITQLAYIS